MKPIRYAIILTLIWTTSIGLSLGLNHSSEQQQAWELARREAITILNKDISFRNWAARHGGVYVPPSPESPPNPYLASTPERDVTTATGKQLTLLNPAYMLRQIQEDFTATYGIKGHITSLTPINPVNRADEWEKGALNRLAAMQPEVSEQTTVNGEPFIRLMLPMITKKGCLKCHRDQGFKEGELRGGVSVSVPVKPYLTLARRSLHSGLLMHGVLWVLGLLGILYLARNQQRWIKEREAASAKLNATLSELEAKVNERTAELAQANEALKEDIEERDRAHIMLRVVNSELEQANMEIKATQSHLLQREKMASIGQLAAGVAHEINNPVGFIHSNLTTLTKYLGRIAEFVAAHEPVVSQASEEARQALAAQAKALKIDYIMNDAKDLIHECLEGTDRVKEITTNLKNFSRVDHQAEQYANLNTCLDETLRMVWNELKYKATVIKEYGELPQTLCQPQKLNQVFVNLLVNAAQAMAGKGEIRIKTWAADGLISIAISDTGAGIPENIRHRLFEPFFTTKEVGKGTGLGLSISYDIVKKHGGEIEVASQEGQGTTFTITLPVREGERDGINDSKGKDHGMA